MTIDEARGLLHKAPMAHTRPQRWMDLGCGTGTFTFALAELLPDGSDIVAVDRDEEVLRTLSAEHHGVRIAKKAADVTQLAFAPMDGVLMANLLHFVKDPAALLSRIASFAPHVLLVEYDTERARPPWVPYPVSRKKASTLFAQAGFTQMIALGERPSAYGPEPLYALSFSKPLH